MPLATKVSPFNAPNYDVFAPARRSDERGIVLGAALDGGQSYTPWIGLSTVRELALKHADRVGLVPIEELNAVAESLAETTIALHEALARVEELEAFQERITGLAANGYRVIKRAGRPVEKVEA